jgi:16S rRNA (cytidine1402-2'-O)-methyltransferase
MSEVGGKKGKLVLVATPIGNLGDITRRAEQVLRDADLIAAEDTRRTAILLNHLGVSKPMLSFFEGNREQRQGQILARIRGGEVVALVSDGGSPSISDPGYELVYACLEAELPVEAVPGPSAAVLALQLSGLPPDRFIFDGFLPRKGSGRKERLASYRQVGGTLVLYEAPHRLLDTLADLLGTLGDAPCAVLREMTKVHEEQVRGPLSYVLEHFSAKEIKGEITIVVRLPEPPDADTSAALAGARRTIDELKLSKKGAATVAAIFTGVDKKKIYRLLTEDADE